ncbi:uncharacterized protein LOC118747061 [Rhagoletis pomonella]|uniref:uncharacterized protein LOC118747061 n=1 Tax=Rhagoletis pomonella TaxID=28610 RepID=UPI001781542C|nr:uncharacterized protein LOC118747061 [Rhagoletis pomonella]
MFFARTSFISNMFFALLLLILKGDASIFIACNDEQTTDCGIVSDCVVENTKICALGKQTVCFRYFESMCHLKYEECKKQQEYIVFLDVYCENPAFMCSKEDEDFD